ncbi:inositol monophosphatase [Streptosporangium sp. NBC_01639]|uniref:inositol monophosphatase family protein n=1 Tax=unclassified Streptosporangium TaxID=2632669 RepID=UPI002DD80D9E|nr:inositol monophosphatase family protein [Streptosporangium sp. NBC_01756]WSC85649.1 inositol monophosphatase [Streptosporangium sp. NBC_01756]WTD55673.1 inositol monophosphatase [Streptosporangium sp. NBC_01639]
MSAFTPLLPVAEKAVELAAGLVREGRPGVLTAKGERDMATEVDFAVERAVRDYLRQETPAIGFLGEEEGTRGEGELTWVLDPIDGTVNFVHGLPLVAVSLGLVYRRRPVLGVVDLPLLGNRYTAVQGAGAHADGSPMRVSTPQRLADAVVAVGDYAVGVDAAELNAERLAATAELAARAQRIRMLGTAAVDLAWVAQGRLDGLIMFSNNPWDTAAGIALVREAGGEVVDRGGAEHFMDSEVTVAGSGPVLDDLVALTRPRF